MSCPKTKDGLHSFKFGKCSLCSKAEGKLADGFGEFSDPGSVAGTGCPKTAGSNGKHSFKFNKCNACGMSEAIYTAQVKDAKKHFGVLSPAGKEALSLKSFDELSPRSSGNKDLSPLAKLGKSVMEAPDKQEATAAAPKKASPKKDDGKDVLTRLTDSSQYTGAHKERFDANGKGKGLAGRDSVKSGVGSGDLSELTRTNLKH